MAISFKEKLAYINKYAKGNDKLVKAVQLGKALEKVKDDTQREKIKKAVNDAFTQIKKINTASSTKTSTAKTAVTKQDKIEKEIEKFKKSIGRSKWITATRYMTNSGLRKTTIEKDAQIPALPKGKRISRKTGKAYWENRANRSDVKQPPVDYPKLAKGGSVGDTLYVDQLSGMSGARANAIREWASSNNLSKDDLLNIIQGLGRKQISSTQFVDAVLGDKSANSIVVSYAKEGKGFKMANGGYIEIDKLYFIGTPEVTSVDKNGRKSGDWKYIVVDENGNKRESILKMKFNEDPKDVRANTENAEYVTQQQFDRMYDKMKGKMAKGGQTDENFKVGDKIKVLGDSYTILSFRVDKSQGYEEERVIMKNDKGETLSYPLDMVIAYSKYAKGGGVESKYSIEQDKNGDWKVVNNEKGMYVDRIFNSQSEAENFIRSRNVERNLVGFESYFAEGGQIGSGKNGYVAFYKGKRIEVYADTKYQAQQLAAKHFKAKKEWEVNVVLAEVDGKPYVQSTAFANGGGVDESELRFQKENKLLESVDKDYVIVMYNTKTKKNEILTSPDTFKTQRYRYTSLMNKGKLVGFQKIKIVQLQDLDFTYEYDGELFAKGGEVGEEERNYYLATIKMFDGSIGYEGIIADSQGEAEYNADLLAKESGNVLSVEHIKKFAKGGMTEHGLKTGDKIISGKAIGTTIIVEDTYGKRAKVDLNSGKRIGLEYDSKLKKYIEKK